MGFLLAGKGVKVQMWLASRAAISAAIASCHLGSETVW